MHRAFCPELTELAREWDVAEAEGRHLVAACRVRIGERVELFNGAGLAAVGEVIEAHKSRCRVAVLNSRLEPDTSSGLVLATALPKGDRSQFLVEKATELGVARIIPLETARSVVAAGDRKLDKLRRTVIEACKQCGRNWLMPIDPYCHFLQFLERAAPPANLFHVNATAGAATNFESMRTAIVGPEGGWTDDECIAASRAGVMIAPLPGHILRIETAGLAVAAVVRLAVV